MINTILYELECGHIMPGGKYDLKTTCYNCNQEKRITDVHVYEWKTVCKQCSFTRWTGLAKAVADHWARAHAAKYPSHELNVLYVKNPKAVEVRKRILA